MAHKTVSIVQEFPQPLSAVFAYLSNHDNLGSVFGAPVKRIKAGSDPSEPSTFSAGAHPESWSLPIEASRRRLSRARS